MEYPCPVCGVDKSSWFPDVCCTSRACCKTCCEIDSAMIQASIRGKDHEVQSCMNKLWKHIDIFHKRVNPKSHIGNGAPKGAFAFTLTKSPADDLTEDDMIIAVRKLMAQKSCPVHKYAWYLEYGEPETRSHPHIHGMYETFTEGRIEAKHFKRAWSIWDEKQKHGFGFRGGYHRPVRTDEGYSNYIAKDNGLNDTNII